MNLSGNYGLFVFSTLRESVVTSARVWICGGTFSSTEGNVEGSLVMQSHICYVHITDIGAVHLNLLTHAKHLAAAARKLFHFPAAFQALMQNCLAL